MPDLKNQLMACRLTELNSSMIKKYEEALNSSMRTTSAVDASTTLYLPRYTFHQICSMFNKSSDIKCVILFQSYYVLYLPDAGFTQL